MGLVKPIGLPIFEEILSRLFVVFFTWSTKIQQQIANGFISNRSDFARARNSNLSTFDGVVLCRFYDELRGS